MKDQGAGTLEGDIDSAQLAAAQFVADDVAVLLSERAAAADVFVRMLAEASETVGRGPERGPHTSVYSLLAFLHTRQSDAALEAMPLRQTLLELINRISALQDHGPRVGYADK